jgi:hypothetical protein
MAARTFTKLLPVFALLLAEQPLRRGPVAGPRAPRLDREPGSHPALHRGPTSNPVLQFKSRTLVDPARAKRSSRVLPMLPAHRLSRAGLAHKVDRHTRAKPIRHRNKLQDDGNVMMAVIGVGGALGAGQKEVAVPFKELKISSRNGKEWLVLNRTKDDLKNAPAYSDRL